MITSSRFPRDRLFPAPAVWLTACALAVLNLGCDTRGEDPALLRRDTVVIGVKDEQTMLPTFNDPQYLTFSPLAATGADGRPHPGLARSWDVSKDGSVRTWHLRDDVSWHDGKPVTAYDVKFTFDLLSHPDFLEDGPYEDVTVIDDWTVRITNVHHNYYSYAVIFPKHLLEDLDPARIHEWDFWTHPVGSGPYRFVRYAPGRSIELEANPDYFRGKPHIEKVVLKFIGEAAAMEALAGNIDIVTFSDGRTAQVLERDGRFKLYCGLFDAAYALYLNHRHPLFSDARIRRAVALAIDRAEILETIGLPRDLPLTDVLVSARQFRRRELPAPVPYDPEAARQLLDEAGWVDQDGDGIREKSGIDARFSMLPWGSGEREVLIQSYLKRVGLAAEIQTVDQAVVWERMGAGDFETGVHVLQESANWRNRYFGKQSIVGYDNPRVAKALRRAENTADLDALDALYVEISEEFARDMPVVILQPFAFVHAVHNRIRGLEQNKLGTPLAQMADLWIEEE